MHLGAAVIIVAIVIITCLALIATWEQNFWHMSKDQVVVMRTFLAAKRKRQEEKVYSLRVRLTFPPSSMLYPNETLRDSYALSNVHLHRVIAAQKRLEKRAAKLGMTPVDI